MPAQKPKHVVIDGSNLATEGRTQPSLAQLNEAVLAFMREFPSTKVTVVVDATFGYRIDKKEVAEFDAAIDNNELVTPPAGAVGRGDGFVLTIAEKVGASVVSNDSYQEFQGDFPWLFDDGRLIGGKPVPHVGWVFIDRQPVRPTGRSAAKKSPRRAAAPMPVPTAPPPGARLVAKPARKSVEPAKKADVVKPARKSVEPAKKADVVKPARKSVEPAKKADAAKPGARTSSRSALNDQAAFDAFVSSHGPGDRVRGTVAEYAAHGVYVTVGKIRAYLPLARMADPAPRSARHHVKIGDALSLVVDGFAPERRGVDVGMVGVAAPAVPAKKRAKSAHLAAPAKKAQARKK
ncbi:MAG: S1 RNA-binding domain-containing protein [Acidobacteria bacterium]|nr:S1 RNA-binding domain-containing protein [Acidobacteriota bacterium]